MVVLSVTQLDADLFAVPMATVTMVSLRHTHSSELQAHPTSEPTELGSVGWRAVDP